MLGEQHGPEDAVRKWIDQVSSLKMCPTFRELQGLDGEPIDFEWKIFPGAKALDILHKIQADLQGKNITPEKFSDRRIFMSMFNDIELEKKNNEDSFCSYLKEDQRYIGHSWDLEKKASGIKDMQPNMVAIFVRHKCCKTLRIQDIRYSRE